MIFAMTYSHEWKIKAEFGAAIIDRQISKEVSNTRESELLFFKKL
jgi:hypothetical protein